MKLIGEKVKKFFMVIFLSVWPLSGFAGYDSNIRGEIEGIFTYSSGLVYIILVNQPTTHPTCNHKFFALDPAIPNEYRSQMLSRAMLAYASKESINIGFDGQGDCALGSIRIHRIG